MPRRPPGPPRDAPPGPLAGAGPGSPRGWVSDAPGGAVLQVLVQPRASRTRVVGEHDGRMKIQLAAPPVDGEANEALAAFLAATLGVRRSDVAIERGATGRRKTVRIRGATPETVAALLREP